MTEEPPTLRELGEVKRELTELAGDINLLREQSNARNQRMERMEQAITRLGEKLDTVERLLLQGNTAVRIGVWALGAFGSAVGAGIVWLANHNWPKN